MQYMLLIYDEEAETDQWSQDQLMGVLGAYRAYTGSITTAGVLVSSNRLQPVANATAIRGQGDAVKIHDGPFAETKEQLGGYYLIEVPDLDAALSWAKRCPGTAYGCVEVRPIFAMSQE